jgi:hypothetical protein
MDVAKSQNLKNILKDKSLLKEACYINGQWITGKETIDVTNPVDDSVIGQIPRLGKAEAKAAIEGAEGVGQKIRQGTRQYSSQMVQPDDGEPRRPGPDHDGGAG